MKKNVLNLKIKELIKLFIKLNHNLFFYEFDLFNCFL